MAVTFSRSATGSSFAALREAMTTSAPCALASSAVARPMPEEPPITTTFLPASVIPISVIFLIDDLRAARSTRLEARANAGLALAEARQFPHAGADWIDVGRDINVDQIGLVGGDALADRLTKVAS